MRNVSLIGIRWGAEHWIVDCGEAAQSRLRQSATMNVSRLNRIFITHMHGDHTWGLLGVIASNLIGNNNPSPLTIYGPPGLADFCVKALRSTYTSFSPYLLRVHELGVHNGFHADQNGIITVYEDSGFLIRAAPIKHSIPCFGYVFEEKERRGSLKVESLRELGVHPGPEYRHIQDQWRSERISISTSLPDSNSPQEIVVDRDQVMEEPVQGRKLVVLGDTCDPSGMASIAQDPCLIIHECTLPSKYEKLATSRGHSTGSMAARFAKSLHARALVLTHFSPRFSDELLASELKATSEIFPGQIFAATDFDVIDLPKRACSGSDPTALTLFQYPWGASSSDAESAHILSEEFTTGL